MKKTVKGIVEQSQAHHSRNTATRILIGAIGRGLKKNKIPFPLQASKKEGEVFWFLKIF